MSNSTAITERSKSFEINTIAITAIHGYQKFVSPLLHQLLGVKTACRMQPSCSDYAENAIRQYGIGRGMVLSLRRLINCQPLFNI
jgi:putative membrane protein insertion efficiency factor